MRYCWLNEWQVSKCKECGQDGLMQILIALLYVFIYTLN